MSESKAKLLAEVERMRDVAREAHALIEFVDEILWGDEIESRHLDALRKACGKPIPGSEK